MSEHATQSLIPQGLAAIADAYVEECSGEGAAFRLRVAHRIRELHTAAIQPITARQLPVSRFVPDLVALRSDANRITRLLDVFAALTPVSRWRQNPNYTASNAGAAFLDGYGYIELIGAEGPIVDRRLALGFLVLGPGRHYPEHHHPAEEVYHPVAGLAEWWREGQAWSAVPPGHAIHHPPNVRHATRTASVPLVALYGWEGDVTVAARLSA